MTPTDDPRYPIGPFVSHGAYTREERETHLQAIATLPSDLRAAVRNLTDEQLDTPYRPGGWTVRQVVHHLPDSHMNAYIRMRLAVTEDRPVIKPYDEAAWALLPDSRLSIHVSLNLLDALHERWVVFLRGLPEEAWTRGFIHPELQKQQRGAGRSWRDAFRPDDAGLVTLEQAVATYAWHGRHHVAHVTSLRAREGW